jgi:hypothetical protein
MFPHITLLYKEKRTVLENCKMGHQNVFDENCEDISMKSALFSCRAGFPVS